MGKLTLESFLTGKLKLWLSITWGLFIFGVLVLPDVDLSFAQYREIKELRAQLTRRVGLVDHTRTLDNRVTLKQKDLANLEVVLVPAAELSEFKQDIAMMARNTGCRLRTIRPSAASRRSFDEVLGRGSNGPKRQTKTPEWEVEEQSLEVSVLGSFENIVDFVSTLDKGIRILQLASLRLHPQAGKSEQLVLELRITTFDLLYSRPK